jgi:hypothetical protein
MKQCPTDNDRSRVCRCTYKLLGLALIVLGLGLALPAGASASTSATALTGHSQRAFGRAQLASQPLVVTTSSTQAVSGGNPPLQVLSWSTRSDSLGNLYVVGEVENTGSVTAEAVQVDLAYENASGTVLAIGEAYTLLGTINPGQKSPFETIATPPAGYAQTVITGISDLPSSTPANTNFTIVVTNTFIDSIGDSNIVGAVTNNNTTTAAEPVKLNETVVAGI